MELNTTMDSKSIVGEPSDTIKIDVQDDPIADLSHNSIENNSDILREDTIIENKSINTQHPKSPPWYMNWKRQQAPNSINPDSFSSFKKNLILIIISVAGTLSALSSTIYYPALIDMQAYFSTTATTMNASLSVFTFFTAFFPLMWASFGETTGRRKIYLISFLIAIIGNICCALSVNISMFIAFRAFSAIGTSSVMSMGAATLSDIFPIHERGRAFAWYACGPLLGPAIGPIVGGYLNQGLGWRSIFYTLAIFIFVIWFSILLFLPETSKPTIRSQMSEKDTGNWKQFPTKQLLKPFLTLRLMIYPNITLAIVFVGVLFFVYYLVNTNFTRTYILQYGLSSSTVGLCYLSLAVGSIIGGIIGGRASDRLYIKRVKEANGEGCPEMRLGGFMLYFLIVLQLLAFVAYGWCLQQNVHYAYGLVCLFFGKPNCIWCFLYLYNL
ncbi:major facilitator superfamily domain-containing protein [Spinellus fusiger]|nr:major facilitator superfamily domain-containing protein [Spinellus fusiger]